MVAGWTDHGWTLQAVRLYRVPPWPPSQRGEGMGKEEEESGQDRVCLRSDHPGCKRSREPMQERMTL
jgi:hypothetical protein